MSLAPNFDLLLTQGQATEVARLIAQWDDQTIDMGEQGELHVQAPLEPTKEHMRHHWDCINPMYRTRASLIHMSDVPALVSPNLELSWLIPIMAPNIAKSRDHYQSIAVSPAAVSRKSNTGSKV